MPTAQQQGKRLTKWEKASPAERRVIFGSHNEKAAFDARQEELLRRYNNHLHLSRADRREARRIIRERAPTDSRP